MYLCNIFMTAVSWPASVTIAHLFVVLKERNSGFYCPDQCKPWWLVEQETLSSILKKWPISGLAFKNHQIGSSGICVQLRGKLQIPMWEVRAAGNAVISCGNQMLSHLCKMTTPSSTGGQLGMNVSLYVVFSLGFEIRPCPLPRKIKIWNCHGWEVKANKLQLLNSVQMFYDSS